LSTFRQLFEESIVVGDVSGVLGLQLPQEHLRRNHLSFKDLLYPTYQVFSLLQSVVESRTVLFSPLRVRDLR
jgi:hypothetical protein